MTSSEEYCGSLIMNMHVSTRMYRESGEPAGRKRQEGLDSLPLFTLFRKPPCPQLRRMEIKPLLPASDFKYGHALPWGFRLVPF